ncbi:MAG TPA: glycosyltransferase family 39 protein [Rugosimonospora sp.]|nr:glycosyltransferase family 39 protein [Rugosimonospora sp.]
MVAAEGRQGIKAVRGANQRAQLVVSAAPLVAVGAVAALLRFWELTRIGFNSDEAVYAGTAASIAGDQSLRAMFPVFRAHPLLFQMLLALAGHGHPPSEWAARAVPATIGVLTVLVTYLLAARLYSRTAGLLAAAVLAVMPYHVVVSRQVLLDGLLTLCATVVLYCVVRYAESAALRWLLAAGAAMGVSVLAKETGVVLLGGLYAFFALTPTIRMRLPQLAAATGVLVLTAAPFPLVLSLAGRAATGRNYLLWQAFRRGNHGFGFYLQVLPGALGPVVVLAALGGLLWWYRERTWRERLLVCWLAVPLAFFTLWPVKGYQYLLPLAPAVAVLAARTLDRLRPKAVLAVGAALALGSLAVPSWLAVNPAPTGTFLAGTGGLPGGREAGRWVAQRVPAGAELLAIGPSMANVLQFYGHRRVLALSVSPNPNDRNPAYLPVPNPDRALRDGQFQYLVWDSYTADRAVFFADEIRRLVDKYHGVAAYTGTQPVRGRSGALATQPVIVIYQVRAA